MNDGSAIAPAGARFVLRLYFPSLFSFQPWAADAADLDHLLEVGTTAFLNAALKAFNRILTPDIVAASDILLSVVATKPDYFVHHSQGRLLVNASASTISTSQLQGCQTRWLPFQNLCLLLKKRASQDSNKFQGKLSQNALGSLILASSQILYTAPSTLRGQKNSNYRSLPLPLKEGVGKPHRRHQGFICSTEM